MEAFVGTVLPWAGSYAPEGWLLCDGSTYPISRFQLLNAVIGNRYGGDGMNTLAVPDLRGRVPLGAGQLPGGPAYALGSKGNDAISGTNGQGNNQIAYLALNYIICYDGLFPQRPAN